MVTKPTVFILGAGASLSYGYPLGKTLKEIILRNFDPTNPNNSIELFGGLGFAKEDIATFREELKHSGTYSIDSFLEHRNEEERDLGKLAIANALIPCENTDSLFNDGSWYVNLLNKLDPKFENFEKNKIAFITFNYDRSLEHFLMTALTKRFKKSEQECLDKLKKIPIIHLYGKLASLPWERLKPDDYVREYDNIITPSSLRRSSKSLKIIYDNVLPTDKEFTDARNLLKSARKIYFLGFGYHTDNLERLKIKILPQLTTTTSNLPTGAGIAGLLGTYSPQNSSFGSSSPSIQTVNVTRTIEGTSYYVPQDLKTNITKLYKIKFPNDELDVNSFIEQKIRLE